MAGMCMYMMYVCLLYSIRLYGRHLCVYDVYVCIVLDRMARICMCLCNCMCSIGCACGIYGAYAVFVRCVFMAVYVYACITVFNVYMY